MITLKLIYPSSEYGGFPFARVITGYLIHPPTDHVVDKVLKNAFDVRFLRQVFKFGF